MTLSLTSTPSIAAHEESPHIPSAALGSTCVVAEANCVEIRMGTGRRRFRNAPVLVAGSKLHPLGPNSVGPASRRTRFLLV